MAKHLQREIEALKNKILTLGAWAEDSVREATQALEERNKELAEKVIQDDLELDKMEVVIEEECLKILALHQPVAIDLRFIIAVLKINNELERIGDLSVNIAERAAHLATEPEIDISLDFTGMAEKAREMLKNSLDSLVNLSVSQASQVCSDDDDVDAINRQMYIDIQAAIRNNPEQIEQLIHLLSTSRHLERIADHATNISEDVIYMIEGEIVRHHTEDYKK